MCACNNDHGGVLCWKVVMTSDWRSKGQGSNHGQKEHNFVYNSGGVEIPIQEGKRGALGYRDEMA